MPTVGAMGEPVRLGAHVALDIRGPVAVVTLDRPAKRNALDMETVQALGSFFTDPPDGVAAAVLTTSGPHFSAGLDLSELTETSVFEGVLHSRSWHRPFDAIQFGTVPVVSSSPRSARPTGGASSRWPGR